jgi:hypothetical protein
MEIVYTIMCTTIKGGNIMEKRHRFTQRGRKYPKRQISTITDPKKSEEFYNATDADAPFQPGHYAIGIIQHPITKQYQVWLSTNGLDVTCLSAHRNVKHAEADKEELKALIKSGDLYNDEKLTALFQKLKQGSEGEPQPLPDDLVRQIIREILRTFVDKPSQP